MLAGIPISRTTRFAVQMPEIPDAPKIALVDGIVVGLIGLTVLALLAPPLALALLTAAGLVGVAVLVVRVATATPSLDDADRVALRLATKASYSFDR